MLEALNGKSQGSRVVISTDSKTTVKKPGASLSGVQTIEGIENLEAETLVDKLATRFPDKKGRIIHGDNSGKPDVRDFIKNINSSLKYVPLDFLIYNSSMQTGVSIDFEAFDEVVGIYSGYTLVHTKTSFRYGFGMRVALVSESSGEKHGVRKAREKKYQGSADADE